MSDDLMMRKGARRFADLSPDVLAQLNAGHLPTVNLVEWLAVDQRGLVPLVLRASGDDDLIAPVDAHLATIKKPTALKLTQGVSEALLQAVSDAARREALVTSFLAHPSDVVRCWAAYLIGEDEHRDIHAKLARVRVMAADEHFGVRELGWMGVRRVIIDELDAALDDLTPWSLDADAKIRRFASEATRPRGVWTRHIQALKDAPERALPLLEPLKADPSRYVQDSVANWLNDASKDQPAWVREVCARWLTESDDKATRYIVKRALRTIGH